MKKKFTKGLLKWNREKNRRSMPWKGEKDPYYVWLSEIIMQQTRVEQGTPYYLSFKKAYPTVKHLAEAKADDVMKRWQGLGYYTRARNLHTTAKFVHSQLGGKFPEQFSELVRLKGVGSYTAAAISSFAFGEKKAVVDGNVIRILARVFGIGTPYDTGQGKQEFASTAQELIDESDPGAYNQAIMDFGASVCKPKNPICPECPFNRSCVAHITDSIAAYPKRSKKLKIETRYLNYLLIKTKTEIFIRKRTENDIWKNLYELPLLETSGKTKGDLKAEIASLMGTENFEVVNRSKVISQMLTHRKVHFRFYELHVPGFSTLRIAGARKVKVNSLSKYAFPRTVHLHLSENSLL